MQLGQHIDSLAAGEHVCLVYDSFDEQMMTIAPYLRAGLENGERCVYGCDDNSARKIAEGLNAAGIDVQAAVERGALKFLTKQETYLSSGSFDPDGMIRRLRDMEAETLQAGYTGLRLTGEMTWALDDGVSFDDVFAYEAALNRLYPGSHSLGICQYSRQRFAPRILDQVLRTHPVAVIRDRLLLNFYYEPPEIFLKRDDAAGRLNWKLDQLLKTHAADEELLRLKDAAEMASRAKSQFLAVMSHELRTPLAGIIGYADLLQSGMWGEPTEQERTHIGRIKASAWHLVSIIDEILTFSRAEAGKEEVHLARCDLRQVLQDCVALLQPQAATKGITLRISTVEPVHATTDEGKVRQVLLNLMGNALKFTDRGEVEASLKVSDDHACIRIRDTGQGIPPDRVDAVFDAFVQLDQSNTRAAGGTGLGLTVSRSLARRLGGDVCILESTPGVGSTFALHLPLIPPDAGAHA